MGFTEEGGNGTHIQIVPNMKRIPGRVKDSDYYVNYDYEMWGKVQVLDKVDRRGVDSEETEVNLAIALLVTVLLIFSGFVMAGSSYRPLFFQLTARGVLLTVCWTTKGRFTDRCGQKTLSSAGIENG